MPTHPIPNPIPPSTWLQLNERLGGAMSEKTGILKTRRQNRNIRAQKMHGGWPY